ncbi:MAG: periplasmic heavy metal sensor [Acidobacteriia bacterium]|nr:periplasmic heavy metal sensor [Terriglobia bacterium]
MKLKISVLGVLLFWCSTAIFSQQPMPGPQPQPDPIGENFFPPELVMQNQQTLGLSDVQKNTLKTEIRKAQTRFTELQWQLQDEGEKMVALVKEEHVDEQRALAELDKILDLEREIKRAQISLVVKIKNTLTAEQQARLQALKGKPRER